MESDITTMCIYEKYDSPNCFLTKANNNVCQNFPDMKQTGKFYCISQDFRPLPPGSVLLCAENIPNQNTTLDIVQVYNPFEKTDCLRFTAWFDPVPYTAPLYISKNEGGVHVSFDSKIPNNEYTQLPFSPIYVLVDSNSGLTITKGHKYSKKAFDVIKDKTKFLFSFYQGGCLPDPNGKSLVECLKENVIAKGLEPTLISYLTKKYKPILSSYFLILIFIVVICLFMVYWFKNDF